MNRTWEAHAAEWIRWARTPGHDSYWRFHRSAFLPLVPEPGRLTVDVGCGEGRLSRDLLARGHRVLALDRSRTMAHAAAHHPDVAPAVAVGDAAALPLAASCADCVVAFMSLQDVDRMPDAVQEMARILAPGGRLVMAIVHPVNSAGAFIGDRDNVRRPFVINGSWFQTHRYVNTFERDGLTMTFHSEHRSLETYTEALADAGFAIERLREPTDPNPAKPWGRIPMFLHIRAVLLAPGERLPR